MSLRGECAPSRREPEASMALWCLTLMADSTQGRMMIAGLRACWFLFYEGKGGPRSRRPAVWRDRWFLLLKGEGALRHQGPAALRPCLRCSSALPVGDALDGGQIAGSQPP